MCTIAFGLPSGGTSAFGCAVVAGSVGGYVGGMAGGYAGDEGGEFIYRMNSNN